ncbi:MAG: methyltransferase domain-containing protein, partial [Candidatus Woesearchaeota archaeon]
EFVKTKNGEILNLYEPSFNDNFQNIKKSAAIINPKDVGMIMAYVAVTRDFIVIDAGAGSGALCCSLAAICKKVYSYDVNQGHVDIVNENIKKLKLNNITCELKDIYTLEPVEKVDLMTIDVPEPWKVLDTAKKSLKEGGYLVLYTPQITQAQKAVEELDCDFHHEITCEIIKRDWEVDSQKLRPSHRMLGHTAFLTFIRYYPKKVEIKLKPKINSRKEARLERAKKHVVASEEEKEQLVNEFLD